MMKRGEIRTCACGCGEPAAVYRNAKGENKGWRGYARGHSPCEGLEVKVPSQSVDLAYMAGIIDGEGCIYARVVLYPKRGMSTFLQLSVTMCSPSVIEWIHENFGGEIYLSSPPSGARRERFHWQVRGANISIVLSAILPYLREKSVRAILAMELAGLIKRGGKNIGQEEVSRRQDLAGKIKAFNQALLSEDPARNVPIN